MALRQGWSGGAWGVKRVVEVRSDGACFVQGDNLAQSTDSCDFGWVPPDLILGQVVSRFD